MKKMISAWNVEKSKRNKQRKIAKQAKKKSR